MLQPVSTPRLRPVIRVFVSSTFSDMKHERNALAAEVYPKLEKLCQDHGFQFQAIDLRWGVSTEAGLDHRTMRICFEELRRAQEISPEPNFIVLLGDRYGWRPLPEAISAMEFGELERRVATTNFTKSTIGEEKSDQGLDPLAVLTAWYRSDENVLLPDPPETDPDRVPLNYILQPRTQNPDDGRDYTRTEVGKDTQDWLDVQQVLWSLINTAFPAAARWFDSVDWARHVAEVNDPQHPKRAIPQIARFQASATEQEIWCGALSATNAERHVIACFREISNRGEFTAAEVKDFFDRTDSGEFDHAAAAKQTALKEAIRLRLGGNKPLTIPFSQLKSEDGKMVVDASKADTQAFCDGVFEKFRLIIEQQTDEYWNKSEKDSIQRVARELEIEQDEHQRFGRERGGKELFVGRETELEAIRDYLLNASTLPLVVHGSSGCGKTALMWRAFEEVLESRKPIIRLIGTTPHSSDIRSLLGSLCQELRQRFPREGALPAEIKELRDEFDQHLRSATPEHPLILFLDALDQLSDADGGRLLNWIPFGPLPLHVKLVVSCLSDRPKDDPSGQPFAELMQRQLIEKNSINLDALSEVEARTLLFDRWLHQAGRTVSRDQRECIEQRLTSPVCRQPIYLKLLFEEARLWRSYDAVSGLGEDVPALLTQLFKRLSLPTNHGELLVERVLGYLAASRHGLAENEILEILFCDPEYKEKLNEGNKRNLHDLPAGATRIPIAIWSRLRFDLSPYLTERAAPGANVLTFYHRQLAEWVRDRFSKSSEKRWKTHAILANFFENHWREPNVHAIAELPFQRIKANDINGLERILCDISFIEARCVTGMIHDLADDYEKAMTVIPSKHRSRTDAFAKFFEQSRAYLLEAFSAIARGRSSPVIQCAANWKYGSHVRGAGRDYARTSNARLWTTLVPFPVSVEDMESVILTESGGPWRRLAVDDAGLVAIGGAQNGVVYVWDLVTRKVRHCLYGHTKPVSAVAISADGRVAISSDGHTQMELYDVAQWVFTESYVRHARRDKSKPYQASPNRICLWDLMSGNLITELAGHEDWITDLSITPDGTRAASSCIDGSIRVWDLVTRDCIRTIGPCEAPTRPWSFDDASNVKVQPEPHYSPARSIAISPDGQVVVVGYGDYTGFFDLPQNCEVLTWDVATGCLRQRCAALNSIVASIRITRDSKWALLASRGFERQYEQFRCIPSAALTLNLSSGETVRLSCQFPPVLTSVALAEEGGKWIVSGGKGGRGTNWGTLQAWSADGKTLQATNTGHSMLATSCAANTNGSLVVSSGVEGTVRLWSPQASKRHTPEQRAQGDRVSAIVLTRDGRFVVTGHGDGRVCFWDGETGQRRASEQGHMLPVFAVLVEAGGRRAVTASAEDSVCIWDVPSGRLLKRFNLPCRAVAVSPDGQLFAVGDVRGGISTFSLNDLSNRFDWHAHDKMVMSLRFSSDGGALYSTAADCTLRKWFVSDGRYLNEMKGHESIPVDSLLSPTERIVIGMTKAYETCLFCVKTGELITRLEMPITESFFNADARRFVTVLRHLPTKLERCIVDVVDTKRWNRLRAIDFERGVLGVQLTWDEKYLLGCSIGDCRLMIYDFEIGNLVAICPFLKTSHVAACSRVTAGGRVALGFESGEMQLQELKCADPKTPKVSAFPLRNQVVSAHSDTCQCCSCGQIMAIPSLRGSSSYASCPACGRGVEVCQPFT